MRIQTHDLYGRLQVGPRATHEEIVRAYRRLAHGAHPDAHPGDPDASQRFRELTEAYQVLADPARRATYDRTNPLPPHDRTAPPAPPVVAAPGSARRTGPLPLWAGPVRIVPGPSVHLAGHEDGDDAIDLLTQLLSILEQRWR